MIVRELLTKWGFKVDTKGLDEINKGIDNVKSSMADLAKLGGAAAATLFGIAKATANAGDEAVKTARTVGMSAERFQELAFAAGMSGVGNQELATSLQKLSRFAVEAASGNVTYKETLDKLGLSVTDANGQIKSSEQLFLEVSDAISKLPNETEKTALSMEFFGRSGAKMASLMAGGKKRIEELATEARNSGFVISNEAAVASEEFNDALERLQMVAKGVGYTLGSGLLKPIQAVVDQTREWILANRQIIKSGLENFVQTLIKSVRVTVNIFKALATSISPLIDLFGGLNNIIKIVTIALAAFFGAQMLLGIGQMVQGFFTVAKSLMAVQKAALLANAQVLAIPILIGAAVVALGLIIEDIIAFFQGRDSVTGIVVDKFREMFAFLENGFNNFGAIAQNVIMALLTPIRMLVAGIRGIGGAFEAIKSGNIGGAFSALGTGLLRGIGQADAGQGLSGALGFGGMFNNTPPVNNEGSSASVSNNISVKVDAAGGDPQQTATAVSEAIEAKLNEQNRRTLRSLAPTVEY